ncbi:hypothetical protein Poli38472_002651 [Pythium oligandrum]|uniref:PX domain-containing protein n=1 Tax=Pythium oligandrum TaxID=41045 RepID=A0A8K1CJ87_PYTOL|nr:hypothetical protein Poli38472_002651 [Pythium oligandrum]|eukprot:TMW63710.1 hypothetical protein Poli38472_002651 [Pythium oligandrum]
MTRTGTAIRSPTKKLRAIDHIEINHFHQRQGVTYYVLDVFTQPAGDALYASSIQVDTLRQRDHHSPLGHPSELTGGEHDNLELQPVNQVERRFSAFEALRNRLSESLETFHPEPCVYCDEFIAFLAQSADQPGLLVKLTTGAPQRPPILERFINRLVQLASTDVDERAAAACDARSVLPQLVEAFLEADST